MVNERSKDLVDNLTGRRIYRRADIVVGGLEGDRSWTISTLIAPKQST